MALTNRTQALLAELARQGDIYARHVLNEATSKEQEQLKSLARRGDLLAQSYLLGVLAPIHVRSFVNHLAATGDAVAQGLSELAAPDDSGLAWDTPEDITYGTALDATQLNATADVDGTFIYHPPEGTILGIGDNQVLRVDFVPDDNFNAAAHAEVHINVKKGEQEIDFNPPSALTASTFVLVATGGDSGNPVTFEVISGPATVHGNELTITDTGDVVITASQEGNSLYDAAEDVTKTIAVTSEGPSE